LKDDQGTGLCKKFSNGKTCYPTRAPKLNYGLGAQYEFNLAGGSRITPRVDLNYQSKIWFITNSNVATPAGPVAPAEPSFGAQDGYSVVNAQIGWVSARDEWKVSVFGKNITNEKYFYGKLSLVGFFGREQGNVAPPAEWGLTIRKNF
jgi:iron complex outermembrane recepter protein